MIEVVRKIFWFTLISNGLVPMSEYWIRLAVREKVMVDSGLMLQVELVPMNIPGIRVIPGV
jgi:hypothetical protein